MRKVIIIGSGPAGLTAGLYTSRAMLEPLCIEGASRGGQLVTTTDVENYPGFPDGVMGPDLIDLMRKQAEKFGTEFLTDDVTKVDFSTSPFQVSVGTQQFEAESIIISTGARPRLLGLPEEKVLFAKGLSTCATCDGAFFRDVELLVVGGGDSAMEEATFLTKFASRVHVVHRRDKLRASPIMQERAMKNEKISFIWDTVLTGLNGEDAGKVTGVKLKNIKTEEESEMDIGGVFYALGHIPNTDIFKGQIDMDEDGYIIPQEGSSQTSVPGVFVGGDCADHVYRQAITAAGMGCMAALDTQRYLETLES